MINGIINVRKEAGFTSHDVVAKLRGILRQKKIGHTGTLDPQATGVLPVCLGKGTRLCDLLTEKEKTYQAKLLLGVTTDTQDTTGTILEKKPVECTPAQAEAVIKSFLGKQQQIPPMYSALKVNGKKLYELAREGVEIERKPRPVEFFEIKILSMELPYVSLSVTCSKGTYIRTLCHDIGAALGCGGCMDELVRTQVGRFTLEDSLSLSEIEQLVREDRLGEALCTIEEMFEKYPSFTCKEVLDKLLNNGNPLDEAVLEGFCEAGWVRAYNSSHEFVGIYEKREGTSRYYPVKMFL